LNTAFEYKYLLKSGSSLNVFQKKIALSAFKEMFEDYINRFGLSDEFLSILEKKKSIALKKIDLLLSGDGSMKTLIEVEEYQLSVMTAEPEKKTSFTEVKSYIEKYFGFRLDMKQITVVEFYTYLQIIKENGRKGNKA